MTNDLTFDQRMVRICDSLSKAGYAVVLVGRKKKNSLPLPQRNFEQVRLNCISEKGKLFYFEYSIRLFFYLMFHKADIQGAVDADTLLPNLLSALIRSRKLSFDAHEYFSEVPEVTQRNLIKNIWKWVEKLCIPKAQLCITVSPALANQFSELYHQNFHVIMNVPYIRTTVLKENSSTFKVIYQGDLNTGRGIELLIKVATELPIEVIIAGDGPLREELEQLSINVGTHSKVRFTGYLQADQLHQITSGCDVGINLLENKGLSYYYSLSNKFFNYIHAGIPQICSAFPEYQLINEKMNICVFSDYNEASLKEKISELMTNKELRNHLIANCKVTKEEYNWEKEASKLVALYEEL